MSKILIKNGRVIDPVNNRDEIADVLIENDKISNIDSDISDADAEIIDAKDKVVCPGLIDMHVHLREPGREDKETIYTGTRAAAAGGFTAVACMPNTDPIADKESVIYQMLRKAKQAGFATVHPIGAITKDSQGTDLSEIGELVEAGAVAVSDDGMPVMNSDIMRRAMEYVKMFDIPVISHAEDKNLAGDGVMNEGKVSTRLGMRGIPNVAESIMIARDITLAELTGAALHIAHLSTKEGVELIRNAKKKGVRVTAEVTPHHLILTDDMLESYDPNLKMNPPLRTQEDVEALKEGLIDGTIDVIASDHAPHTIEEKDVPFDEAPFGIIGLETMLGLILTEFVEKKVLTLEQLIEKMSINPSRILNLNYGNLEKGATANITIIDLNKKWSVNPEEFYSKAINTPFVNYDLKGKSILTIVEGKRITL
jgi:dihydroorotase